MPFDRQAALQAGYSQEEIDAYLQNQNQAPPPPASIANQEPGEPPAPTTTVTPAGEGNFASTAATAGLAAAHAAVPAAIGYGVGKYGGRMIDAARNLVQGGGSSAGAVPIQNPAAINVGSQPVAPAQPAPRPAAMPKPTAEAPQMNAARNIVQKLALDKVLKSAGAPGAVAAGGAALTGLAGGQMGAMTPQQRKGFYDNPMLGAMGGDAGLAAAIMNRGQ